MIHKILLAAVILLGYECLCVSAETDFIETQPGIETMSVNADTLVIGCTPEQGNCKLEEKSAPTTASSESEPVCDEPFDYNDFTLIPVAQIHERLVSLSWPNLTGFVRSANARGYTVLQIRVSTSGKVCHIEPVYNGNNAIIRIISESLIPEIKKWEFHPNKPFWGIITIGYEHRIGFRLL